MKEIEREEFARRLQEQRIFDELKDCVYPGINYIRRKWQGMDLDYSGIHRRIVNYQVRTYGEELRDYQEKRTKERIAKSNAKERIRRYQRRNG